MNEIQKKDAILQTPFQVSDNPDVILLTVVQNAVKEMNRKGYASKTIEDYVRTWKQLLTYAERVNEKYCIKELLVEFARKQYGETNIFNPSTNKVKYYARFLLAFYDYYNSGIWITHRSYKMNWLPDSKSLKEAYLTYETELRQTELKVKSITLKLQILKLFLKHLEKKHIQDIKGIKLEHVLEYIKNENTIYSTAYQSSIIITLRAFFNCPVIASKLANANSFRLLKVSYFNSRYENMPSGYTSDEIRSIFSIINRATPEGKKDYAFILMAVDLGLRVSDIINLKLNDIKWNTNTIELVQQKTGEFISLPLTDNLRWALLDYLMNSRSQGCQYNNVFLRLNAPFVPYVSGGHYYKILNRYFKLAGINTSGKHHGMHSLRHSLATRLMNNDIPLTVITESLGHKYANVTRKYIRVDIEKLRLAALEVPFNV